MLESAGSIVGLGGIVPFEQRSTNLQPGERRYLYTDGLLEQPGAGGRPYGQRRLCEQIAAGRDIELQKSCRRVIADLRAHAGAQDPEDDITLFAVEHRGGPRAETLMPNTLAHLGLQAPLTRLAAPAADLKWIALGCVIPDLPWILQRILLRFPAIDPYGLRLYVMVQASLAFSLMLAAAAAVCARRWRPVLAVLGANVTLHLLLDACQTKWANGVHFLAPFSWRLTSWELFWPDSRPAWLLTAAGLAVVGIGWRGAVRQPANLRRPRAARAAAMAMLLGGYFLLPALLTGGPLAADNHSVATLTAGPDRSGRTVAFDRADFVRIAESGRLITFGGERLEVVGPLPAKSGKLSARAEFVSPNAVRLSAHHLHRGPSRDWGSAVGLALTIALWAAALRAGARQNPSLSGRGNGPCGRP